MTDPNPRKTIRKNINHLKGEVKQIKSVLNSYLKEIERLKNIEKNGSVEDARDAIKYWDRLDWTFGDI